MTLCCGGKLIEVAPDGERLRLWCVDAAGDEAAVFVLAPPGGIRPACGDAIHWRGRYVIWQPAKRWLPEVVLTRIGFAFDPRPGALVY